MSRLTRDETAEPVSRDQILRRGRGQGNIHFPVLLTTSRIGNLTVLIITLDIHDDHTYIHMCDDPPYIQMVAYGESTRRFHSYGTLLYASTAAIIIFRVFFSLRTIKPTEVPGYNPTNAISSSPSCVGRVIFGYTKHHRLLSPRHS